MRLSDGLEMLEISANVMGRSIIVYPTLFWDNETIVLVDAGHPGLLLKFREAMDNAGIPFDKLNKVIITHQDIDHIGTLPDIRDELPQQVEVLSHAEEKPYIQGDKPLIKSNPEEIAKRNTQLSSLSEKQRNATIAALQNPPKAQVDKTLSEGDELPYCGGINVIHTPGHTPGHICLYHKQSKTLIAGDAMIVVEGQLLGPVPHFAKNLEMAKTSLKNLTQYDITNVICYHGGLYQDNPNLRIAELANI